MNFLSKALTGTVGILASSVVLADVAQAGTLTYDFRPFDGYNATSPTDADYQATYGFADGWGTTFGEGKSLFFNPGDDVQKTISTGNPNEVKITGREGTGINGVGQIRYNRDGLAVKSTSDDDFSAGTVDGLGAGNESLILQFQRKMRLLTATFLRSDSDDKFFAQVSQEGSLVWQQSGLDVPNNNVPFAFSSAVTGGIDPVGNAFRFWALGDDDNWTLAGIETETVPEPAAMLGLLAVGLAGATTVRRQSADKTA